MYEHLYEVEKRESECYIHGLRSLPQWWTYLMVLLVLVGACGASLLLLIGGD